jgi:plasmid stabilization system protein ParE
MTTIAFAPFPIIGLGPVCQLVGTTAAETNELVATFTRASAAEAARKERKSAAAKQQLDAMLAETQRLSRPPRKGRPHSSTAPLDTRAIYAARNGQPATQARGITLSAIYEAANEAFARTNGGAR